MSVACQDVTDRLSLPDQRSYQFIQRDQLCFCQIDSLAALSKFLFVFLMGILRIIQVFIEETASGFGTAIAYIRWLFPDWAWIVHKIGTKFVA